MRNISRGFADLVGQSKAMQSVFELMRKVSSARFPLLIMGETGTGKGLAAYAIHAGGPRQDKPYFALDCAALVPSLIETELFGHVRGAFTGAAHSKTGLLEMAPEGTLLLDEIGELPMNSQSRLLSAIEEKKVRPVGSNNYQPFRARIIATTNRNLDEEVREGRFRKDLFFRLNVLVIYLPTLRERKEDIPMLCEFLLDRLSDSFNGSREQHRWELSSEAMDCLLAYDWPGNVRELRSCLERSVSLGTYPIIQPSDLLLHGRPPLFEMMFIPSGGVAPLAAIQRTAILDALAKAGGDKQRAARSLGIGKSTLYRKLQQYYIAANSA